MRRRSNRAKEEKIEREEWKRGMRIKEKKKEGNNKGNCEKQKWNNKKLVKCELFIPRGK